MIRPAGWIALASLTFLPIQIDPTWPIMNAPVPLRRALCLVIMGTAGLGSGCAALPGTSQTATAAGGQNCAVAGRGAPVVVFEGGIGEKLDTWDKVYPQVQVLTTVFAYTRRGYPGGGPAPAERDGALAVEELRTLLSARGLRPPYVLVGHSLGGLYAELFTKLHPAEVAGVVLVDPTPVDHLERLRTEFPAKYALLRTLMTLQAGSIATIEQRGVDATSREWHAAGPFPKCPMIVLTGIKASVLEDEAMIAYKLRAHAQLLQQWPGSEGRQIECGHFIQRDKPEAVVAAVREIVSRMAAKNPVPKRNAGR